MSPTIPRLPLSPQTKLAGDPGSPSRSEILAAAAEENRWKGLTMRANHLTRELARDAADQDVVSEMAVEAGWLSKLTPRRWTTPRKHGKVQQRGGTKRLIAAFLLCVLLALVAYHVYYSPHDGTASTDFDVHVRPAPVPAPPARAGGVVPVAWLTGAFIIGGAGGFAAGQHNAGSAEVTHAGHGISVEIIPL
jgi:hypothetical protein